MRYEKVLSRIRSGEMSRADLTGLRDNAIQKLAAGDADAQAIISEINIAKPKDQYILFMGFCPGADFNERLDTEWKAKGICRFDYLESTHQLERFSSICVGDLVILKKREQFGKTMKLYGHGRVTGVGYDDDSIRFLKVDWSSQDEVIEVPLMGCNSTVDIKNIEVVESEMPEEFYRWRHQ